MDVGVNEGANAGNDANSANSAVGSNGAHEGGGEGHPSEVSPAQYVLGVLEAVIKGLFLIMASVPAATAAMVIAKSTGYVLAFTLRGDAPSVIALRNDLRRAFNDGLEFVPVREVTTPPEPPAAA